MRYETTLLLAAMFAFPATACGGKGSESSPGGSTTSSSTSSSTTGGGTCSGTNVVAAAANNYAFSSTLTFPPVKVTPKTELSFDWGGANKDLIGHPVDPHVDINTVSVLMFDLTLADLQTKLNADSIGQRDLTVVPLTVFPDGTSTTAKLFSFSLNGNPIDSATILLYFDDAMYPPANHTYALMAATGTTIGQGTRMIQSFQLDPTSTNTNVTMTGTSTTLDYTANLHSLTATAIPAGQAAVRLDWGTITVNALGNPFNNPNTTDITDALVAHYTQTPTELETKFLDLEIIATDLYRTQISSGTVVDFSTMMTSAGKAFTGIDATGTWVVALRCGGCRNPAPWYLSVLKPCN